MILSSSEFRLALPAPDNRCQFDCEQLAGQKSRSGKSVGALFTKAVQSFASRVRFFPPFPFTVRLVYCVHAAAGERARLSVCAISCVSSTAFTAVAWGVKPIQSNGNTLESNSCSVKRGKTKPKNCWRQAGAARAAPQRRRSLAPELVTETFSLNI